MLLDHSGLVSTFRTIGFQVNSEIIKKFLGGCQKIVISVIIELTIFSVMLVDR